MSQQPITWALFELEALVNVDDAVASFLYSIALRSGDEAPLSGSALLSEFAAIRDHQVLLPHRPYKHVLRETLSVWCEQMGYPWHDSYADGVAMTVRSAQPYPEATNALRQASESGLILALVAESDHDLVCHSLNHLRIGFEEVVISEDSGSCRPDPGIYQVVLAQIDESPGAIAHISPNLERDLVPAGELGVTTVRIDRSEPTRPNNDQPERVWSDLWGVQELGADSPAK